MDSKQDLKEEIAKVAYEIYEQKGTLGTGVENWLEAERIYFCVLPSTQKNPILVGILLPFLSYGGSSMVV